MKKSSKKRSISRFFTITLSLLAVSEVSAQNLCNTTEKIYFSCLVKNKKIISVCGTKKDGALSALQYRFGTPQKLELLFPAKGLETRPAESFVYNRYWRMSPATIENKLDFQNNDVGYTVFYTYYDASVSESGKTSEQSGVKVVDADGNEALVGCTGVVENNLDELQGVLRK